MLMATMASAQNLDEGKSPARLFADGCSSCHRSARALAKGRFSLTLSWFLKDHYATSSDSAKALASYLESVDSAPRAAAKSAARSPRSSQRPPQAVPQR
jgi:mono/diheme cytochrome c family protein